MQLPVCPWRHFENDLPLFVDEDKLQESRLLLQDSATDGQKLRLHIVFEL
jgi:hypothetical protein